MTVPALNWSSLIDSRDPKFTVKGTRIAQAVYGWRSRFAIVEVRTRDADGYMSTTYRIADVEAASDAHYAAGGVAPFVSGSWDDLNECVKLIDGWSEKQRVEYETFMAETE